MQVLALRRQALVEAHDVGADVTGFGPLAASYAPASSRVDGAAAEHGTQQQAEQRRAWSPEASFVIGAERRSRQMCQAELSRTDAPTATHRRSSRAVRDSGAVTSPVATTRSAPSDPRGLQLRQGLSMGVMRFAIVTGATAIASVLSLQSGEGPVWDGLNVFLLTAAAAGSWSALDAWRTRLLAPSVIAWSLATVLLVVLDPLPRMLSYPPGEGGWTGLGDYVATVWNGAGFMFALTAVPAAAGLTIGRLVRRPAGPPTGA